MNKENVIKQLEELVDYCVNMLDDKNSDIDWKTKGEILRVVTEKLASECGGNEAQSIIREMLAREGMSQQQLANKIGMVRQSVSQMLTRGDMRFCSFIKMTNGLGYEILCRKKFDNEK